MKWKIEERDSGEVLGSWLLPGNLGFRAVSRVLRQLAARHLSPEEIVDSNLRKGSRGRRALLDVSDNNGILQIGENPYLVGRRVDE